MKGLHRIINVAYKLLIYCERINYYRKNGLIALYPAEINQKIKLPLSFGIISKKFPFVSRSQKEVLLREIANQILSLNEKVKNITVIDIGAWIGDNAVVWALKLSRNKNCNVIAIDPANSNIKFISSIKKLNNIKNLIPIKALCSSDENSRYSLIGGNIDHGRFKVEQQSPYSDSIISTTIDNLNAKFQEGNQTLLIHLDVEGLEYEVMMGAKRTIERDLPYLIFECHIKSETIMLFQIKSYLKNLNYQIYMINEILPECALDCRNFLAVPSNKSDDISKLQLSYRSAINHVNYFPATPDKFALIEI